MCTYVPQKAFTRIFIAAKYEKRPSTVKRLKKSMEAFWYIHTVEYYTAIKKRTWLNLKNIILSDKSQTRGRVVHLWCSGTASHLWWWRWDSSWHLCEWLLVTFYDLNIERIRSLCGSSSICTFVICAFFCKWSIFWWKRELKISEYINALKLKKATTKSQYTWFIELQEVWNPLNMTSHLLLLENSFDCISNCSLCWEILF